MGTTADRNAVLPRIQMRAVAPRVREGRSDRGPAAPRLDVVHLAAECWPFARTGGLGEAVASLAAFQAAQGSGATVVMPLYRTVRDSGADLRAVGGPFSVAVGARVETAQLYRTAARPGTPRMFFIAHDGYFDRSGLYGEAGADYADNGRRFALFCRAALHALPRIAPDARIVHAHDWHAALAMAGLGAGHASHPFYRRLLKVLSVHNASFQGIFPLEATGDLGLPAESCDPWAFESYGRINCLKGALACCDLALTVSPTHARELRTPEGGFGLHETFAALGDRLAGVTNGIDDAWWDPATDAALPARFTPSAMAGKSCCKAALQRGCGLEPRPASLLVAMCARLVEQKGFDLILGADLLAGTDAQFVFVGRGEERYERALAAFAASAPGRVALRLDFTDALEHQLLAGADALLMPSLYEPCGMTQMRAQRYGTIPIARRVGGLADTIEDGVTGFLFGDYSTEALRAGVRRAAGEYADSAAWSGYMLRAMRRDFGGRRAADAYDALYRRSWTAAFGDSLDGATVPLRTTCGAA
jgi:starch synthase